MFGFLVFNTVLFLPKYEPNLILFRRFSKDDFKFEDFKSL